MMIKVLKKMGRMVKRGKKMGEDDEEKMGNGKDGEK